MGKFKHTKLGKAIWKIGDTLKGETKVGRVLYSALLGIREPLPTTEGKNRRVKKAAKDLASNAKFIEKGIALLRESGEIDWPKKQELLRRLNKLYDLTDDGQINDSQKLSSEAEFVIQSAFSVLAFVGIVTLAILVATGNVTWDQIMQYLSLANQLLGG